MTSRRIRVMIVDDHPLVRVGLASLLNNQADIEISGQADSATTALEVLAAHPVDVAIVDLTLKGRSGFDLMKDMRVHHPRTAILVLSMHEEVIYAERALRAGALGYLMKGEESRHVADAVRTVHAGRMYANSTLLARVAGRIITREVQPDTDAMETLSDRELDIFQRLGRGCPTRQISTDLNISIKTVQAHCANIKEKLGITSATELFREAVRWSEARPTA